MAERSRLGACNHVTGSLVAGNILYRMTRWKPTLEHKGRLWIARPYADLAHEVGITVKQAKAGIAKLRKLNFVSTSQHLFHGRNVLHLMVTSAGLAAISEARAVAPNEVTQVAPNEVTHIDTSYLYEAETELEKNAIGPTALLPETSGGTPVKAHELLAQLNAGKSKLNAHVHKPDTVSQLVSVWMDTCAAISGTYQPPLTQKARGQLKHMIKGCPPGKAAEVLELTLKDWITFAKTVESQSAKKGVPVKPDIGFLLSHLGIAINLAYPAPKPTFKAKPPPIPQTPAPVQPAQKPEAKPLTHAEMLAAMNGPDEDEDG